MSVKNAAAYLALSVAKVYELLKDGTLPSFRIIKNRRVSRRDLDAFLKSCRETTTSNNPHSALCRRPIDNQMNDGANK